MGNCFPPRACGYSALRLFSCISDGDAFSVPSRWIPFGLDACDSVHLRWGCASYDGLSAYGLGLEPSLLLTLDILSGFCSNHDGIVTFAASVF